MDDLGIPGFDDFGISKDQDLSPKMTVSEFLAVVNETLEYSFSGVEIEGEVSSFKINQGKWVFFDLKDEESSVACFLPVWELRMPVEDGMKVVIKGAAKVTKWGKFSVTVRQIRPVGEGNLKKSFEMLKKKLKDEGLFDVSRKRPLPSDLSRIGVISSTQAAGYADFCKIINARWGGLHIYTAHTQVQGLDAPDQIIRALKYFNEQAEVQVIAILRGGGSADDLSAFNDEKLVRAIATSRIPVITGIGHEVDESLADLAADVRASTPSNAAEMLTPDKSAVKAQVSSQVERVYDYILQEFSRMRTETRKSIADALSVAKVKIHSMIDEVNSKRRILDSLNPENTLKRGYAIISGEITEGNVVKITTFSEEVEAKVNKVKKRIKGR